MKYQSAITSTLLVVMLGTGGAELASIRLAVGSSLSSEARRIRLVQPHMAQIQSRTVNAALYAQAS